MGRRGLRVRWAEGWEQGGRVSGCVGCGVAAGVIGRGAGYVCARGLGCVVVVGGWPQGMCGQEDGYVVGGGVDLVHDRQGR